MQKKRLANLILITVVLSLFVSIPTSFAISDAYKGNIYQVGTLKPIDSKLKVKIGDPAPNFILPPISGEKVSLSRGLDTCLFRPMAWLQYCKRYFQPI